MKRVLVTGATGFVGRHTLALLAAKDYEVHAVTSRLPRDPLSGVTWHVANLLEDKETKCLLSKVRPTHLLHFAWYAEPGKFWRSSENFRWLEASITLIRQFHAVGGQRIVMAGTCAEYDWDFGFLSEGITPCKPTTPYGVCKNALQEVLRTYSAENGLNSAWGRLFFLYGSYEHPARLMSSVINSLLRGEVAQCTHGNQIRDFLHIEDAASAFVALLDSPVEGAVNIASGRPIALREMVLAVANYLKVSDRVQFGAIPALENDPPLLIGDIRRLTDEVMWRKQFDLTQGIIRTVDWWIRNSDRIKS